MKLFTKSLPRLTYRGAFLFMVIALSPLWEAWGQTETPTQSQVPSLNIVPTSPEAASLGKYGDIPVGLYTGVPNISIPLYTIDLKGVKVPISLSYHSSGVKADELASNVGLGWTLSYGGAVTSSVHGIPDDFPNSGWLYVPEFNKMLQDSLLPNSWDIENGWVNDPEYEYMTAFADGSADSQPDLYYVNMNGRSFKLFYDQNQKPYTMPYQRVKISGIGGGITVTDESDNLYKFHEGETSNTHYVYWGYGDNNSSPNPPNYPQNTYYLSSLETPYGEKVNYTYESYSYSFENQPSETRYAPIPYEPYGYTTTPYEKRTESTTYVSGKRISKITTNRGHEIIFTYGYGRKDLLSSDADSVRALTRVQVVNARQDTVVSYTLHYSHFSAVGDQLNPNTHRLKLVSVERDGLPPHTFEYNGTPPARLSRGQDHWGYINNAENITSGTLLPSDPSNGFDYGANREPNGTAAQLGILKKITYPTGGHTTFDYEPNHASITEYVENYKSAGAIAQPDMTIRKDFEVGENATSFKATYKSPNGTVEDPITGTTSYCTVTLHRASGEVIHTYAGEAASEPQYEALVAGQYYIEIITQGDYSDAYLDLAWEEPGYYRVVNEIVGGVRVKAISSYPVEGTPKVQRFEYLDLSDPSKSSGVVNFMPQYLYRHHVDYLYGEQTWLRAPYNAQSTSSLAPLGTVQGGVVAYTAVTVYTDEKTKGYTAHKFSHIGSTDGMYEYPFGPVISNNWVDGLPLETRDYAWDENAAVYRPVKRVINKYKTAFGESDPDTVNSSVVRGAKVLLEIFPVERTFLPEDPKYDPRAPSFGIAYYRLFSSWSYPKEKTEILYDPADSTQKVISTRLFHYDNPKHIQLTREEITKGNGEKYLITYRYPLDLNAGYAYSASPVVEKRVFLNDSTSLLTAELTPYENKAGSFPISFYSLRNTRPLQNADVSVYNGDIASVDPAYEQRLIYTYREKDGSRELAGIEAEGSVHKSYLWDYLGLYPIAEAVNADTTDIAYTSFETDSRGQWKFLGEPVSSSSYTGSRYYNPSSSYPMTRGGLSSGTTYVVSLWVKGSGSLEVKGTTPGSETSPPVLGATANGGWTYREYRVSGTTEVTISGEVSVDEVRLYPVGAQMTTYTYDPLVGVTFVTGPNGRTNHYEYDKWGRLRVVKDDEGNVLKSYEYHYKGQQ